jgi:HK97 family phage major capsid protein
MSLDAIMKAVEQVETKIANMSDKASEEIKNLGKVTIDTKTALDALGVEQRTQADRLLQIEQKSSAKNDDAPKIETYGAMFIASAEFKNYLPNLGKTTSKVGVELKNTISNAVGNTFSERRPGIVEGAFREFTIEDLLISIPTTSSSIDYVRENVFTNGAAETAEGAQMPQTSITFTPESMPVQNVAHFVKITRQLAQDNASLAAYVDRRMVYGANLRVENQIVAGNGTAPNLSGLTKVGNFTAHGYSAASLTSLGLSPTNRLDLIGKMIGDCAVADYPADVVLLNTADWWTLRLAKDGQGRYLLGDPASAAPPMVWGRPVVATNAMVAGKVWVGSLKQAATLHNREGILLDMSDSDENNFQLGLVTIRAMRRLALTVERPSAARYGDLVPA